MLSLNIYYSLEKVKRIFTSIALLFHSILLGEEIAAILKPSPPIWPIIELKLFQDNGQQMYCMSKGERKWNDCWAQVKKEWFIIAKQTLTEQPGWWAACPAVSGSVPSVSPVGDHSLHTLEAAWPTHNTPWAWDGKEKEPPAADFHSHSLCVAKHKI